MKRNYDALLFDMDGVLVDVTNSYRKTIKKTAEYFLKRKIPISEVNEIKNQVGMNNDWDATYALIGDKTFSYQKVKNMFQKKYLGTGKVKGLINNETLLIPKEKLSKLKKIYGKLGIVTGRPKEEALYVIDRFNLQNIFGIIVTKEDTKREKPFPDPILKAIKDLNVKRGVYIGDSPSDIIASRDAGIPSIYIGSQKLGTIRFESPLQVVDYLL